MYSHNFQTLEVLIVEIPQIDGKTGTQHKNPTGLNRYF